MIRKPRILVVGIFVMDLIASTKQAPNRGETVIGLNFRTAPGGKGAEAPAYDRPYGDRNRL